MSHGPRMEVWVSPSGASRHLPINGEDPNFPMNGEEPSSLDQPLRRLRRHLPMNGEDPNPTNGKDPLPSLFRSRLLAPPVRRSFSIALLVGFGLGWIWGL